MAWTDTRSQRLRRAVASLAESGPQKPPAGSEPLAGFSENLVFEFDEAYTSFVDGVEALPSESQMIALQAVDSLLAGMVSAKDAALWTEKARRESAEWSQVRALAERVMAEFAWNDSSGGAQP